MRNVLYFRTQVLCDIQFRRFLRKFECVLNSNTRICVQAWSVQKLANTMRVTTHILITSFILIKASHKKQETNGYSVQEVTFKVAEKARIQTVPAHFTSFWYKCIITSDKCTSYNKLSCLSCHWYEWYHFDTASQRVIVLVHCTWPLTHLCVRFHILITVFATVNRQCTGWHTTTTYCSYIQILYSEIFNEHRFAHTVDTSFHSCNPT